MNEAARVGGAVGYQPMTDRDALLRAILADPDDDTPRLVYADRIQDDGEDERAEFIRAQVAVPGSRIDLGGPGRRLYSADHRTVLIAPPQGVHAIISRGFVSAVTLDSRTFLGGPCPGGCVEFGSRRVVENPRRRRGQSAIVICPTCHGTGRTPGVARDLFARHPVTAVTFTDLSPWEGLAYPGRAHSWTRADGTDPHFRPTGAVPKVLFDQMWEGNPDARARSDEQFTRELRWPDRDSPVRALSAAAVAVGRREAGIASAIPTPSPGG